MSGARPLLVTSDAEIIDEVLRLAAVASVDVHLATDVEGARGRWSMAPLVLVGADLALALATARLPRRRDVVTVSAQPTPEEWQVAVALGAEHVVCLPDAERWLIDRLTDCGEGRSRDGAVLAVMGAGGGSGASTLAAALAMTAATRGLRSLLVDADPLGGGVDLLLGLEDARGARWEDLADTRGRLSAVTLQQGLPAAAGVSVLSWGRQGSTVIDPDAVGAVLDAGERGFDLVVVDAPRVLDATAELVLGRARETVVACGAHVRSAAAAARLVAIAGARCASVSVALRRDPRGVDEDAVADALGPVPVTRVPFSSTVPRRADDGDPPPLTGPYGRAVADLLDDVLPAAARSA